MSADARCHSLPRALAAALTLLLLVAPRPSSAADPSRALPDITFIHVSDVHVPVTTGPEILATLADPEAAALDRLIAAGDLEIPLPSLALATGDLTEYGGGQGAWEQYLAAWRGVPFPVYHVCGNHDATWWPLRPEIRALHGAPFYSFDRGGYHFIGLDSTTPHDPLPGFGEEVVRWLAGDLARLAPDMPIFVFFHHPVNGGEWASRYDRERVLGLLRPHRVLLVAVGHAHRASHRPYQGFDAVVAGAPYGDRPGYNIVSVRDQVLRVVFRPALARDEEALILERDLREPAAPAETAAAEAPAAEFWIDDQAIDSPAAAGAVEGSLVEGFHARVGAQPRARGPWCVSAEPFEIARDGGAELAWVASLPGAVRGPMAAWPGGVAAADLSGRLSALSLQDGTEMWTVSFPVELAGGCTFDAARSRILAADLAGLARAIDTATGAIAWERQLAAPVTAPLVLVPGAGGAEAGELLAATRDGAIHRLDAATGAVLERWAVADYTIEAAPLFAPDPPSVFVGAWDGLVRRWSVDAAGRWSLVWARPGAGSLGRTPPKYWSVADAPPVLCAGRLYAADRAWELGAHDPETGHINGLWTGFCAVAALPDGTGVIARGVEGNLVRFDPGRGIRWSVDAELDRVPAPPTIAAQIDTVFACSGRGLLSAVGLETGALRWQYQVSPLVRVLAPVLVASPDRVLAADIAGRVVCLRIPEATQGVVDLSHLA